MCDRADGQRGAFQQDARLAQPVIQQVVLDGYAGKGFEQAVEIGAVDIEMVSDVLYADLVAVSSLYEFQCLLSVVCSFLVTGVVGAGEFAGEQKEILIHDAVHDEVTVVGELVRLKHFLMTEPHLVVLTVMNDQIVPECSPLQVPSYLDALHPDPCVAPGGILVRFVIDEFAGTDEKGIALPEAEQFSSCLVNAAAVQYVVNQVSVAQYGTITVSGRAVFIAAGVDHRVDIPEKIIGKIVILHDISPLQSTVYVMGIQESYFRS